MAESIESDSSSCVIIDKEHISLSKENNIKEEQIDDWKLEFNFFLFAQHEKQLIFSPHLQDDRMYVECVESLTPVDMMNLGSGIHDATGHCVWTGAFLLVDALPQLETLVRGTRVLELGCGTGLGGIALLKSRRAPPAFVALSDGDPDALQVCLRNCQHNNLSEGSHGVLELMWGNKLLAPDFDVVLATDVLYDIGLLPPLFQTATDSNAGVFILSHVPRACYSSDCPPVDNLEDYIVQQASGFGWELEQQIRPEQLEEASARKPAKALNDVSLEEMSSIGASIFIFRLPVKSGNKAEEGETF